MPCSWLCRLSVVIAAVFAVASAMMWLTACSTCHTIDAGFWFEEVAFDSRRLHGPITRQEVDTIASIARAELTKAFTGLNITFSDNRNATHRD